MKTLNVLIAIIILAGGMIPLMPVSIKAAPQEYNYTYNLTNLYANYPLVYLFTGLTDDIEYTWNIQRVGLDGSPQEIWTSISRTPSAADAGSSGFLFLNFPNIDTPFRVTDNFGRVLGRHFLSHNISTSAYWNTAGENALLNRTEIRKIGAMFSPTLVDNNGSAIDGLACCNDTMGDQDNSEYVVQLGDYLLVHYNIDQAVTESFLEIRSLTNATLAFRTDMLEVVDYNLGDGYAFSTGLEYKDFIVLSTVGSEVNGYVSGGGSPFIDPVLAVAKFPTSSIPMYANLGYDFYECSRINNESTTAETYPCEYMIGVNPSTSPMTLTVPRSFLTVRLGNPVNLRFRLQDASIWNALNDNNLFLTTGVGSTGIPALITALEAAPFTNQSINITPTTAFSGVEAYWTICAGSQFYQSDWLLCLSDVASFTVSGGTSLSFTESINEGLIPLFGFDNDFSHIFVALLIYIGSFAIISLLARRTGGSASKQLYDLVFIGESILLVIIGWFDLWTSIIVLILCVLAFMHMRSGGETSEA